MSGSCGNCGGPRFVRNCLGLCASGSPLTGKFKRQRSTRTEARRTPEEWSEWRPVYVSRVAEWRAYRVEPGQDAKEVWRPGQRINVSERR